MTPFILALLTKLTLILTLGLLVSATLRNFTPSLRHLILFAAVASCVVLPFAMWMSPQWNVAVLPRPFPDDPSSANGQSSGLNPDQGRPNPVADSRVLGGITNAPPPVIDASNAQSPSGARRVLATLPLLPFLWLIGFIAVMGWLAIGRFRLRRIAATSWPLDGSDWNTILADERRDAGVDKSVILCSSSVVSTPLTWGSRAPVILLPEDALDWPEAHRRIVLRHELAHVARGDSFSQLVAGFVCALYWFHPLAWIAERRLRAECERACDDKVVSLGTPAAEYAAHLLEVARSARAFGAPGFLSVAMARPSQLEGRLLAVLNESRRRVALSRGAKPAAAILSALVLIPLAAFRAVPKVDEPGRTTSVYTSATTSSLGGGALANNRLAAADTTFQLSVPARSAGTLTLDLKTGGKVIITGWDKPQVFVRASLAGHDWRETQVTLQPSDVGARLQSDYTGHSVSQSFSHVFELNVPRNFNVRISSAGGSLSINGVDGDFTGQTGGGEINLQRVNGKADIQTGGGNIHVSDSRLSGRVSTGAGVVRIEGVTGNLKGYAESSPVTQIWPRRRITSINEDGLHIVRVDTGDNSPSVRRGNGSGNGSGSSDVTTTTTYTSDGVGRASAFAASGIRMNSAGGAISLPSAPNGAHVTTGGGRIRIGRAGGEVYAETGGGPIDIGPATGSVEAHTGGGDVTIELEGTGAHSVDVTSGKGQVVLVLPRDLNATLELETAYTNNLGHKTRIVSDLSLQTTETANWDSSEGTPRRYVRARQIVGRGGSVIRVRTINGDIVLQSSR